MLNDMGKDKGWIVKQMHYEPCMFTVDINGRKTYLVVHTDDIDGAAQDPRDGAAIIVQRMRIVSWRRTVSPGNHNHSARARARCVRNVYESAGSQTMGREL